MQKVEKERLRELYACKRRGVLQELTEQNPSIGRKLEKDLTESQGPGLKNRNL